MLCSTDVCRTIAAKIHIRICIVRVSDVPVLRRQRTETVPVYAEKLHDCASDGGEDAGAEKEGGEGPVCEPGYEIRETGFRKMGG